MSIFRRREARQWTPEPFVPPFPGVTPFGGADPTMSSALRISAVWACVRLIADTISMMPMHAYTLQDGIRVRVTDPPLLQQPGGDANLTDWLYMLVVSLMLRGNAYGRIMGTDSQGYPSQIELMNPDTLNVRVDRNTGRLTVSDRNGPIAPSQLWRVAAYRMPGSALGLSPISYAATTLSTDAEVQQFALGYFRDALHPASVLTSDQSIPQEHAREIKERLMEKAGSREPLVLGAGLKYSPLSVSPNESQFLDTQKYTVATICRIFGVPPEMVAAEAGNSMTYSNVEQRAIDFLTYSIQPWLTRIESAMATLMPGRRHPRFDTSVLLRTDYETQMRSSAIGIASKQLTPDEAREARDLPPLTEEQKQELELVPLTVSVIGRPTTISATHPPDVNLEADDGGNDGQAA